MSALCQIRTIFQSSSSSVYKGYKSVYEENVSSVLLKTSYVIMWSITLCSGRNHGIRSYECSLALDDGRPHNLRQSFGSYIEGNCKPFQEKYDKIRFGFNALLVSGCTERKMVVMSISAKTYYSRNKIKQGIKKEISEKKKRHRLEKYTGLIK